MSLNMCLYKRSPYNGQFSIDKDKAEYIVERVGYWRNAYPIHKFFVENLRYAKDGYSDNSGEQYITPYLLETLLGRVNEVLESSRLVTRVRNGYRKEGGKIVDYFEKGKVMENSKVADSLLPCQGDGYYVDTPYDEKYYKQLQSTKEILEDVLANWSNDSTYYYQCY